MSLSITKPKTKVVANSMFAINPYKKGLWKFDDASAGLVAEPFVGDVNEVIDKMSAHIPNTEAGFTLLFGPVRFPRWQVRMVRLEPDVAVEAIRWLPASYQHVELEVVPGQRGTTYKVTEAMLPIGPANRDVIGVECWFCPALFCYFPEAPAELFGAAVALG
jgi:hypothetical protein